MPRPKKKDHDAEAILMTTVLQAISLYEGGASLARAAREMKTDENKMNPLKVRKLLITGMVQGLCVYESDQAEAVLELYGEGCEIEEIMEKLQISRASVYSYIPYQRVMYTEAGSPDASVSADRIRLYRQRKKAVEKLREEMTEESLWSAVVAFQHYPFRTVSGLPFTYTLKIGRTGSYTKELLIDRRENSKSLSWSSVALAFDCAMKRKEKVITRPKELGDIRGISYIYPMLWRFGIIEVPDNVATKMEIQQNRAVAVRMNDNESEQ